MSDEDECTCEFDPYEHHEGEVIDELDLVSWHHKRTCEVCGEVWWALHCPHDGVQNPCPGCGWVPEGGRTPLQFLGFAPSPPN